MFGRISQLRTATGSRRVMVQKSSMDAASGIDSREASRYVDRWCEICVAEVRDGYRISAGTSWFASKSVYCDRTGLWRMTYDANSRKIVEVQSPGPYTWTRSVLEEITSAYC